MSSCRHVDIVLLYIVSNRYPVIYISTTLLSTMIAHEGVWWGYQRKQALYSGSERLVAADTVHVLFTEHLYTSLTTGAIW